MMDPMISAEKRTAMFRYRLFRRITTLIRYLEALTLTLVAVWSSARIPTAAKASGDFLRHSIIPVLLGPRFLFLLGNAIVLTLLFKSRHLTASTTTNYSNSDDDDDIIGNHISSFVPPPAASRPEEKVVVFEDKNVCVEASPHVDRTCRRSRSERIEPERRRADLRRSKTEVGKMKMKGDEEDAAEFRRVIEAFIEKQLKFQREESMAIVCPNPNPNPNPNPYAGTVVQVKEII